jgi:hypothetical protein
VDKDLERDQLIAAEGLQPRGSLIIDAQEQLQLASSAWFSHHDLRTISAPST